jgi:hypothetical protein
VAVTYTQELLDRAVAYLAQPIDQRRRTDGLADISQLVADINGQPVGSCRQCQYADHLATVKAYITQATRFLHPDTMSTSQYAIAPAFASEVFVHENYSGSVTAETLTDQAAEFFIKNGYRHAFLKDGKAIPEPKAAAEGGEAGKPAPALKKADYQLQYEQLLGEKPADSLTIAELTKAIADKQAENEGQRD